MEQFRNPSNVLATKALTPLIQIEQMDFEFISTETV